MRALLSLALAFAIALVGTVIARALDPTVFGSCFEGSCGYAAMLVALLGTLVLAPVLWIGLRRAGPLSQLLLGFVLFALIGGLLGFGALSIALVSGAMTRFQVPDATWILLALGTVGWLVNTWHRYKLTGTTRLRDMLRGEIARNALTYTVLQAGLAGLSSKPLAWRRTPKFALNAKGGSILADSLPETLLGIGLLVLAGIALAASDRVGANFAALSAISIASLALRFLCAPYLAWLALRHARVQAKGGPRVAGLSSQAA